VIAKKIGTIFHHNQSDRVAIDHYLENETNVLGIFIEDG